MHFEKIAISEDMLKMRFLKTQKFVKSITAVKNYVAETRFCIKNCVFEKAS